MTPPAPDPPPARRRLVAEEWLMIVVPVLLTLGLIGCYLLTEATGFWH